MPSNRKSDHKMGMRLPSSGEFVGTEQLGTKSDLLTRVQQVYDAWRTSRMNVIYYSKRLATAKKWHQAIDTICILGTSGAITSLAIWHAAPGTILLAMLIGAATILNALKRKLNCTGTIKRYRKLRSEYNVIFNKLSRITEQIQIERAISTDISSILDRMDRLSVDDDLFPDLEWLRTLQDEVEIEIPANRLWWPSSIQESNGGEYAPSTFLCSNEFGRVLP